MSDPNFIKKIIIFPSKNINNMFCRPKFRGEVEMPVLLGNDDPAHSVTILDQVPVDQED